MPLSVSFTLVNLLRLATCPVLSTCEYVSPVSHLTHICLARSNGCTVVGELDIQPFCMLIAVRSSVTSFLPSSTNKRTWPASWFTQNQEADQQAYLAGAWFTQNQEALKPGGYV